MEPFAFLAAKAAQRSGLFVADERLELIAAQQPTGDSFPDCKIAVLIRAGETLESLDDRRTALRAPAKGLSVRHVLVRMKMLGFPHDVPRQIADVAHERVARELPMFNLSQAKFPFAGEFRAGYFRHRVLEKCDRLDRLAGWSALLSVPNQIMS